MVWTHIYDLVFKLLGLLISIAIVLQVPYLADSGMVAILAVAFLFLLGYNYLLRTLATYCYCRFTLKMDISLLQAKPLNKAFTPAFPSRLEWLPMKALKDVDSDLKYQIALDTCNRWQEDRKVARSQSLDDFKSAKLRTKVLTVIAYILVFYFFFAGLMDLPPADTITRFYCRLLGTDRYYPLFNAVLLAVPTLLIFKAIDKDIK